MSRSAVRVALCLTVVWAMVPRSICGTASAQAGPARTVLGIYFSTEDYPANPTHDAGIRQGLLSRTDMPIDYFTEYLESDRFPQDQAAPALRDYIQQKYRGRPIDVVIAITDTALRFVLRYRDELFPGAPIVYFGNTEVTTADRSQNGGLTGVVVAGGFRETLALALKLHPATERTFVIAQTPNITLQDSVRSQLQNVAPPGTLTYIAEDSIPGLIAAVKAVPPRSLILYIRQSREDPGKVLFASDVASLVAAASPVPVYGVSDSYLGSGVVGGAVFVARAAGVRIGEMARQILDGAAAQDIAIEHATVVPTFDWRQTQRWGISESALPAGSRILYRQPDVWEQYRWYIAGAGLLVLLQTGFIAALLIQRSRRVRAQKALRDSEERLRLMVDALRTTQERYAVATAAGAVGVWDWNFETEEIYVDPTLKAILGFEDAEIANRVADWGARVHPLDVPAVMAATQACVDGRVDEYEVEHRMMHRDGGVRWFLSRGSLVRRADGAPAHMVGTNVDITARKLAEEATREHEAVVRATNRELQDLAGRLIAAQEVDRARIARDLHDDLSQQLAGLSIALSALKRRLETVVDGRHLQDDVASLQQRTIGLAGDIRSLSHELHPSVLEHAGLVSAMAAHCAEIHRREIVEVTFTAEGDFSGASAESALCFYRVAQEGLRNVVTHAAARHATVELRRLGSLAELTITDDGKGFDIGAANTGLGLVSIHERARLLGGTVSFVTEVGKGTRIRVEVPTNRPVAAANPLSLTS